MSIWFRLCFFLPSSVILSLLMCPFSARSECMIESVPDGSDAFVMHLSKACTDGERLAHAIHAEALLEAIQRGQEIDLIGVVVVGNLFLDQLPLVDAPTPDQLPPLIQKLLASRGVKTLRVISRSISIRDSRIQGTISTRLKEGYLLLRGPVTMTGTTCEDMVDLSHTLFSETVNLSDAVFRREGLFIQTMFNKPTRFERVAFGVHTRFHRARFIETVTFEKAGFNGLAEFLEVVFDKEANFSYSNFKMGTGFSGARFAGNLDFSDVLFERDVYFLFTRFNGDATFRGATFRGQADFSDAEFHGMSDFSRVSFTADPVFQRTKLPGPLPTRERLQSSQTLYGVAAGLLVCTVLCVWIFRSR
ncbi:MAG: pentapeptide repeat-containing protein [Nitrospirota bacterium]|nr:pentapeptide repeat-containing protein [Nitrospirota bacterium]